MVVLVKYIRLENPWPTGSIFNYEITLPGYTAATNLRSCNQTICQYVECNQKAGCRTVSNNGSGLAPAQNILAVQVWFGFT